MIAAMYLPRFFVKQKLTMIVNRFEVYTAGPGGNIGQLMASAEQKRVAFRDRPPPTPTRAAPGRWSASRHASYGSQPSLRVSCGSG
jgi:hypothetical protein